MLYGFRRGLTTVVAAASSAAEHDAFYASAIDARNDGFFSDESVPDLFGMMSDDDLARLKKPPYVFEHADLAQAERFAQHFGIEITTINKAVAHHDRMLESMRPSGASDDVENDTRSISEIHSLDWHDPHDHRTDEQKKQDEKYRQIGAAAAARGELSGESFSPNQGPTDPNARLTSIEVTRNADGSVSVESAFGVKGMNDGEAADATSEHKAIQGRSERQTSEQVDIDAPKVGVLDRINPEHYVFAFAPPLGDDGEPVKTGTGIRLIAKEVLARVPRSISVEQDIIAHRDERSRSETASSMFGRGFEYSQSFQNLLDDPYMDNENTEIDPKGRIAKFHRVTFLGAKVETVVGHLVTTGFDLQASHAVFRNNTAGCWIAFVRKAHAQTVVDTLDLYGVKGSLDVVDKHGQPVVEEEEIPAGVDLPRPWNSRALELATMTEAARAANLKSVKGDEFVFTGSAVGERGNVFYVAPRQYFDQHGTMFKGSLNIAHILPGDVKEIGDGMYQVRNRSWQSLKDDLVKRGFHESWDLQIHLNTL